MKDELKKIENDIKVLRETIDDLSKWRKGIKILCDQSKKPHKCPVCDGYGTRDRAGLEFPCDACGSKGVIWG